MKRSNNYLNQTRATGGSQYFKWANHETAYGHASIGRVKPPLTVVDHHRLERLQIPNLQNTLNKDANGTLPPISRDAITMVMFFLTKMTCKFRYKERETSCPRNGMFMFLRQNSITMVQNPCKHDVKHKYMQRYHLHAMNEKFET